MLDDLFQENFVIERKSHKTCIVRQMTRHTFRTEKGIEVLNRTCPDFYGHRPRFGENGGKVPNIK